MKTAEQAAEKIRRAYQIRAAQYPEHGNRWMTLADIWGMFDLTHDELAAGILHLTDTDRRFIAAPESNQKALTAEQRRAAVRIGGQDNHLIAWETGTQLAQPEPDSFEVATTVTLADGTVRELEVERGFYADEVERFQRRILVSAPAGSEVSFRVSVER
jgi:hypothetical protein